MVEDSIEGSLNVNQAANEAESNTECMVMGFCDGAVGHLPFLGSSAETGVTKNKKKKKMDFSISDNDIEHRNSVIRKEAEATCEVCFILGAVFGREREQMIKAFHRLEDDDRRRKANQGGEVKDERRTIDSRKSLPWCRSVLGGIFRLWDKDFLPVDYQMVF
ncbi:hypothetical protein DITRI_Ditri14bG0005100 [Diplodiscus trichospermus]